MYQLGVMGTADLWLTDHLLTTGSLFANLANNYDKFNYTNPPQDSHLPRVRTHVREYVQNDVYVNNLQANYFQHLGNGFYGQVYGGYLETMFGGAGQKCCIARWTATGRLVWMPTTLNSATGVAQRYDEIHRLQRENRTSDRILDAIFRSGCVSESERRAVSGRG